MKLVLEWIWENFEFTFPVIGGACLAIYKFIKSKQEYKQRIESDIKEIKAQMIDVIERVSELETNEENRDQHLAQLNVILARLDERLESLLRLK